MFYSDDPARDWDNYCDYLEREHKRIIEENYDYIYNKLEYFENIIEDIKYCKTKEEIFEVLDEENISHWDYDEKYKLEEIKQEEITNIQKSFIEPFKNEWGL